MSPERGPDQHGTPAGLRADAVDEVSAAAPGVVSAVDRDIPAMTPEGVAAMTVEDVSSMAPEGVSGATTRGEEARQGESDTRRPLATLEHNHVSPLPDDASLSRGPQRGGTREIVLVTGISGSGKSIALHALEDAGFFCVDNLPPELLPEFLRLESERSVRRVAVAVDVRTAGSLPQLVPLLESLRNDGVKVRPVFLDASTDTLVRRFSETRRPHPLSKARKGPSSNDTHRALIDAIELERELLAGIRARSTILDTSQLRPVQLRQWIRDLVGASESQLVLVFQSFAFKRGVPLDADMVFDVRVLPNPYYLRELRPLTGRDPDVADYLRDQPEAMEMLAQIEAFLQRWLPNFSEDQRSYLTVAIGCTGGQHRSVFMCEALAERFSARVPTLLRHRELEE